MFTFRRRLTLDIMQDLGIDLKFESTGCCSQRRRIFCDALGFGTIPAEAVKLHFSTTDGALDGAFTDGRICV